MFGTKFTTRTSVVAFNALFPIILIVAFDAHSFPIDNNLVIRIVFRFCCSYLAYGEA